MVLSAQKSGPRLFDKNLLVVVFPDANEPISILHFSFEFNNSPNFHQFQDLFYSITNDFALIYKHSNH